VSAGFQPSRFWEITPREAEREYKGLAKTREREANERLWLAWHTVALDRTDKLPKLETLLIKSSEPKRRQTGEEMLLAMKSIFLAFGGDPAELGNQNEPGTDR
jgi:hypothetical protein